jgi:hypothetical protein
MNSTADVMQSHIINGILSLVSWCNPSQSYFILILPGKYFPGFKNELEVLGPLMHTLLSHASTNSRRCRETCFEASKRYSCKWKCGSCCDTRWPTPADILSCVGSDCICGHVGMGLVTRSVMLTTCNYNSPWCYCKLTHSTVNYSMRLVFSGCYLFTSPLAAASSSRCCPSSGFSNCPRVSATAVNSTGTQLQVQISNNPIAHSHQQVNWCHSRTASCLLKHWGRQKRKHCFPYCCVCVTMEMCCWVFVS